MTDQEQWNDPSTYPEIGDYIEVRLADGQIIRGDVMDIALDTTGIQLTGMHAWPADIEGTATAESTWWTWSALERAPLTFELRKGWRIVPRPAANKPSPAVRNTSPCYPTPTEVLARIEATRVQALDDLRANVRLALRSMRDYTTSLQVPHGTHRVDAEIVVAELRAGDDPWDAELLWTRGVISFADDPAMLLIRVPKHLRPAAEPRYTYDPSSTIKVGV